MITEVRAALAADLADLGVTVHQNWPDRVTPPCALLVPPISAPYVTGGQTFGAYVVNLDVVLLVTQGSHDVVLPALEALVDTVLGLTVDWGLTGVDAPGVYPVGGIDHLGTVVHLNRETR